MIYLAILSLPIVYLSQDRSCYQLTYRMYHRFKRTKVFQKVRWKNNVFGHGSQEIIKSLSNRQPSERVDHRWRGKNSTKLISTTLLTSVIAKFANFFRRRPSTMFLIQPVPVFKEVFYLDFRI